MGRKEIDENVFYLHMISSKPYFLEKIRIISFLDFFCILILEIFKANFEMKFKIKITNDLCRLRRIRVFKEEILISNHFNVSRIKTIFMEKKCLF